jgi:serine/threonine protein kinase
MNNLDFIINNDLKNNDDNIKSNDDNLKSNDDSLKSNDDNLKSNDGNLKSNDDNQKNNDDNMKNDNISLKNDNDLIHNSNTSSDNNSNTSSDNNSSESSSNYSTEKSDNSSNDNSLSDDDIIEQSNNLILQGCILNKYNILVELGRGTYSVVWLAYDIENLQYYAIKVQNPNEYKDGINENLFMKKIPDSSKYLNKIINDFVEIRDGLNFLCTVYELHCSNLDHIIRKGDYNDGLPFNTVKKIMIQLLKGCDILHSKLHVYHGDIKTDNILLKGISKYNEALIKLYNKMNFSDIYIQAKTQNDKIYNDKKKKIRARVHSEIYNKIINILEKSNIDKYDIDNKYIITGDISLSDFGSFVENGEYYDESFGTRYYRSPENILVGPSSYPNDIWALGCTFYELLTGELLFNPKKDKTFCRDSYHLKLINEGCGRFPSSFLKTTKLWKKYFNSDNKLMITEDLDFLNTVKHNLKLKLDNSEYEKVIKILLSMLKINPIERLSAKAILKLFNDQM